MYLRRRLGIVTCVLLYLANPSCSLSSKKNEEDSEPLEESDTPEDSLDLPEVPWSGQDVFVGDDDCTFVIQEDIDVKKAPVLVTADRKDLVRPKVQSKNKALVYLKHGESIILGCTGMVRKGVRNKNPETLKTASHLACSKGTFQLEGRPITKKNFIKSFSCTTWARSNSQIHSSRKCGNSGNIVELGFQVGDSWIPQVTVCQDIVNIRSLYTHHKLYGQSLVASIKTKYRKSFTQDGGKEHYHGLNLTKLYSKEEQTKTLEELLQTRDYVTSVKYLAKGHLVPDADHITFPEQMMTYFFSNAAPQWQPFNAGYWFSIENAVRRLAIKKNAALEVYTGTGGILTLPNSRKVPKEVYLDGKGKRLPAPELYWKLVRFASTDQCTVVVGVNNIYLARRPHLLCPEVHPSGWPTLQDDLKKGFVYYCTYADFAQAERSVPSTTCTSLLQF